MSPAKTPTSVEVFFDDIIVSKTDTKGRITYANKVFAEVCGYSEVELIGKPHSILRHPDMPRCVFKLLWDAVQNGREIFAYVKNITRNGDFYWVFAHVTPSFDSERRIIGYHSNRRVPERRVVATLAPLYAELLAEEACHRNGKDALEAGYRRLVAFVNSKNMSYDQLVFSL
ncbi:MULTISPECIES: PAS domain-containing protein [Rhodopseudomonas]|uniref:Chemotaxis protein n=1 Tax=Rhodopseudomonas palustris TaxID=1076 RepID=A0A0D7F222_RHOPL|nr:MULTISPECIES: PAS domain-containing protein [Rhodopseudomonas]KIZ46850.1 chemotaxis protein [Rhodopseudomonas palustris]MDF3813544.1 PAS domain-containing protein [Rhodopseudomonas sp. BAL398]WOK15391.1 PAS domain-containing protein [Rhodopseudomonas sp. BAL398]